MRQLARNTCGRYGTPKDIFEKIFFLFDLLRVQIFFENIPEVKPFFRDSKKKFFVPKFRGSKINKITTPPVTAKLTRWKQRFFKKILNNLLYIREGRVKGVVFYNNAQTHGSFPPKSCIKSESLHLLLFPIILVLNLIQNSRNSNTLLLTSSDILLSGLFGFLLLNFSFLCSERYKSFRHWLHRCSFSLQRVDKGWFYFLLFRVQ